MGDNLAEGFSTFNVINLLYSPIANSTSSSEKEQKPNSAVRKGILGDVALSSRSYENKVETVRGLVETETGRVANLLKNMVQTQKSQAGS